MAKYLNESQEIAKDFANVSVVTSRGRMRETKLIEMPMKMPLKMSSNPTKAILTDR